MDRDWHRSISARLQPRFEAGGHAVLCPATMDMMLPVLRAVDVPLYGVKTCVRDGSESPVMGDGIKGKRRVQAQRAKR